MFRNFVVPGGGAINVPPLGVDLQPFLWFKDTTAAWPECVPITFSSQLEPRSFSGSLRTKKTEGSIGLCIAFPWANPDGTSPQTSPTPDAPFVMAPQRYAW